MSGYRRGWLAAVKGCCGILLGLLAGNQRAGAAVPDWIPRGDGAASWHPGGDAVLLMDREQVRFLPPDAVRVAFTLRRVLRANRSAGIESMRLLFRYDPGFMHVTSCNVWIVSQDGTANKRYRLQDFTDSVAIYSSEWWDQEHDLAFDPKGKVDVGDTLAWELTYEQDRGDFNDTQFSFFEAMPCRMAEFEVIPSPGGRIIWSTTAGSAEAPGSGSEPGALLWRVGDLTELPKELPSGFIPNPREVYVRCLPGGGSSEVPTWPAVAAQTAQLLEPAAVADGSISSQARALATGKAGRWERIRALTEFVQHGIVYLEIELNDDALAGYRPHAAADVLRCRYGDCKDKAALLIAMLRAIGEDGRFVLLYSGYPKAVQRDWPAAGSFNHAIVAIPADSGVPPSWPTVEVAGIREVIFDPTNPVTPLGVLPAEDQGGYGLVVDPHKGGLFRFPAGVPSANSRHLKTNETLAASGDMEVAVEETWSGLASSDFYFANLYFKSRSAFDNVINRTVRSANPVCSDLTWADDWEPAAARYRLSLGFKVPGYGHNSGGAMMLVSPDPLPVEEQLVPWERNLDGVVWFNAGSLNTEIRMTLPAGYVVDELPDPWKQQGATSSAEISFGVDGNAVVVSSHLERQAGFYARADYEALRGLYDGLRDAARGPVVLRKASAGTP